MQIIDVLCFRRRENERTNGRWWQSGRTDGRGEERRGEELR